MLGRSPANFRQQDVTRAIAAAKRAGLDVVRVEVDPKTARISLIVKDGEAGEKAINPFDTAPVRAVKPRRG
jgi:hypothetical protein